METFLALCDWLEVPPAELELINSTEKKKDSNIPEAIAIQLRADKNLDPATANALASLVKAAYQDLSQNKDNLNNNMVDGETQYTLEELLEGASSEDFEGEYDWGEPVGEKIW